ncbi:MAG: hypothetical protein AAGH65_08625 [Pseudomonadota bacterium]
MKRLLAILLVLLLTGCNINSSVSVPDGGSHSGDLSTVNGSVRVGVDGQVDGDASTINGSITIGDRATVEEVSTVNGSATIGDDVVLLNAEAVNGSIVTGARLRAAGSLETVNGKIDVGPESVVDEGIFSVNGALIVRGAEVGSITTVNGSITLEPNSRVNGEILVERPRGFSNGDSDPVQVVIGANSEVVGPLTFERPVDLRIHETATVGEINGAEPVYFNQ